MSTPAGLDFKHQVKECREARLPLSNANEEDEGINAVPIVTALPVSNSVSAGEDLYKQDRRISELERRLREYDNINEDAGDIEDAGDNEEVDTTPTTRIPSQHQQHANPINTGTPNQSSLRIGGVFLVILLAIVGIAVAGVCASGNCGGGTSPQEQTGSISSSSSSRGMSIAPTMTQVTSMTVATSTPTLQTTSSSPVSDPTRCPGEPATTASTLRPPVGPTAAQIVTGCNGLLLDTTRMESLPTHPSWRGTSLPSCLGQLTALTYLDLDNDQLTGTIPTSLGQLTALRFLSLFNNQLTGTIPTTLGQLTALKFLSLSINQLAGAIPTTLGQLTALAWLSLPDNQLTGTIPTTLGQLTALTRLSLSFNHLTGTIPTTLGQLTELPFLYLHNNQLTGTIPTTLGQLTTLFLSNNQLTGTIPTTLGQLTGLRSLWLQNNQLTGTIPTSLGQSTAWEWLYLENNQLTGTIPDWASAVSFTNFTGNQFDL